MALPDVTREASGVAVSRRHPGVFWIVDDSGAPELYAVGARGALLGRMVVPGGLGRDREDLALGPCGPGDCLYVGDVGDNAGIRDSLTVYRVPEPEPGAERTEAPRTFSFRLPDGPRDIEALFVLPGERLHVVTKGRHHPPTMYRFPGPLRAGSPVTLTEVQRFGDEARHLPRQVTGADASRDGGLVALRTYETLDFFRVVADTLAGVPGTTVDLRTLREPQGEAVGVGPDGLVVLAGEAGPLGRRGSLALLNCETGPGRAPGPRGHATGAGG